jgi:hypothetical protein
MYSWNDELFCFQTFELFSEIYIKICSMYILNLGKIRQIFYSFDMNQIIHFIELCSI